MCLGSARQFLRDISVPLHALVHLFVRHVASPFDIKCEVDDFFRGRRYIHKLDYVNEKAAFDESDENDMNIADDVGGHSS